MSISILSTSYIDKKLFSEAADGDIEVDVIPFTKVSYITGEELQHEIKGLCNSSITAVFTSANAIKAIAEIIREQKPKWTIYSIGSATQQEVLKYFPAPVIKGIADNASSLADIIIEDDIMETVFFCGDKRLDVLPEKLKNKGISLREIIVYRAEERPVIVEKAYNCILFFSPANVHSYFRANGINAGVVIFTIGNTTSAAVKEYTSNLLFTSSVPSKEKVVADAIQYLKKCNCL